MKCARATAFAVLAVLVATGAAARTAMTQPPVAVPQAASGYVVTKTIPLPGDEGWDYVYVDSDARRAYISHGTRVLVMDLDSQKVVGTIEDTQGVHGIAVAPELGRGFISNGRSNTVTIFDTNTLKTIGTAKTGTNPDAIIFDPASKRVFVMNGRSGDITVIDAATGQVTNTIPVGGKLEFSATDGKGNLFVNVEDKSQLVVVDTNALKVTQRWPLAPCQEPSGLAMDRANRRLFVGCDNKMMAVVDADSGHVIATPAIGDGVDATAFDPSANLAFSSNGDGSLTVVKADSPSSYKTIDNVKTKKSARTMGLDTKTHTIYLPAADLGAPTPTERRGKITPGSFVLVVVERK